MLKISRRYAHFLFAVIQSGVTSAVAAAVASSRLPADHLFLSNWLGSWLISWALMVPIVLFAAPTIQRLTVLLTSEDV
jgi:Protein of unknown function (DUF2798)